SRLALVTVLQRAENLTGRMAAEAVRTRLDWKYLLGLPLEDPGSGHSVLPEFRAKVAARGAGAGAAGRAAGGPCPRRGGGEGLGEGGGERRTDSARVVAAVAELTELDRAGESVGAAVEALTAAPRGWVAGALHVSEWTGKSAPRAPGGNPPASKKKQDELAV